MGFEERETRIANILETYFSDASLLWDKVMLSKMLKDPEKMVTFEELSNLPKFKSVAATAQEIVSAAENHSLHRLKLDQTKQKIGRIKPYIVDKKEELDEWSIYVEGLKKPYDNEQSIKELFSKLVGSVSFFRVPPNQKGDTQFFGYCFLEFNDKSNVERAVRLVNRYNRSSTDIDDSMSGESDAKELADKLNLRVMSKSQWNDLKDGYLNLLAERKAYVTDLWTKYESGEQVQEEIDEEVDEKPFTEGLIVFVDGLHPQCPKTIAIELLQTSGVQLAFMHPKKKGLSSTHIRLNTAEDAIKICNYFDTHYIVQEDEKDRVGNAQGSKTSASLKLKLLQGSAEEIYWENEYRQGR
ncbi:glucose repression mediator protein [Mucor velutinosus]|uniref:Glucose repression mediator protein n=1 Tax=Mucor velutinosus TaxID=708070 RepID=A0AAN7DJB8_9FUNG|nr:glucose repression mediator protein [Mucor velutinosus]